MDVGVDVHVVVDVNTYAGIDSDVDVDVIDVQFSMRTHRVW